ncbi:hypothetical protein [Actinomadura rubrisoli]|uniref:Uncharacterized protein n=1 Tax=Actinomadura rubrisoli TaxID=2530368 RepID=A0A4R5AQA1_9ACTN|nr:hypothetical protein [Actinomadura rubrisoli]TDD75061.1 hypothetical protein E1298_31885 [Actinomadura rubrisoli]
MALLDELHIRLRSLDDQEEGIRRERAAVLRAFVRAAGGVTEASGLLGMDPRTVVKLQRLDEIAMIVYRSGGTGTDPEGRVGERQREADSRWWRVARASRPKIRLLVVVDRGIVRRIWPVMDTPRWDENEAGKVALPLGERPLTSEEVAEHYPDLGIAIGDERPIRKGLLREHVPVDGAQAHRIVLAIPRSRI